MWSKLIICLVVSSYFFSCSSAQEKRKKTIELFLNEIQKNESIEITDLIDLEYTDFSGLKSENTDLESFNTLLSAIIKEWEVSEYEILSYEEFSSRNEFKGIRIIHEIDKNVYCVVKEDKLLYPIVFDDVGKIISFFPGLSKSKDIVNPFLLNEEIGAK